MIAISYRREDSLPIAGRLYDRLQAKFGKPNVFMDFDSIPPGVDFREQIKQTIERSKVVIAIIGPDWIGEQGETSSRIDDPNDFVRLEIAHALKRGIPVIPVLINNTPMPRPEKLPADIGELAFRNAVPLDSGMDFHHHADRLIAGIGKLMDAVRKQRHLVVDSGKAQPTAPASPPQSRLHVRSDQKKLFIWCGIIFLAVTATVSTWLIIKNHQHKTAHQQLPTPQSPKMLPTTSLPVIPFPTAQQSPSLTSGPAIADQATGSPAPPSPVPSVSADQFGTPRLARVFVKRYGVSVLLPGDVFPDFQGLSNGEPSFLEYNGVSLMFYDSQKSLRETFENHISGRLAEMNQNIDYKVLKDTWFVVSGTFGVSGQQAGFYTKGVKKGKNVIIMRFHYNEENSPISDETLTAISRSFDGN